MLCEYNFLRLSKPGGNKIKQNSYNYANQRLLKLVNNKGT